MDHNKGDGSPGPIGANVFIFFKDVLIFLRMYLRFLNPFRSGERLEITTPRKPSN